MDGCMSDCMDGWMDGSIYEWVIGYLNRIIDEYTDK